MTPSRWRCQVMGPERPQGGDHSMRGLCWERCLLCSLCDIGFSSTSCCGLFFYCLVGGSDQRTPYNARLLLILYSMVCHLSCSICQSRASSFSSTLEVWFRLRVKRAALCWIFSIQYSGDALPDGDGSHTLEAYLRMGLTIDFYALSLIFLDTICRFRLRKPSSLFPLDRCC